MQVCLSVKGDRIAHLLPVPLLQVVLDSPYRQWDYTRQVQDMVCWKWLRNAQQAGGVAIE